MKLINTIIETAGIWVNVLLITWALSPYSVWGRFDKALIITLSVLTLTAVINYVARKTKNNNSQQKP